MIQGKYVIFSYNYAHKLKFDFEGIDNTYKDYNNLDLSDIDKEVIIVHIKLIQNILIQSKLKNKLNFIPSRKLELNIFTEDYGQLLDYLDNESFERINVYATFDDLDN